MVKYINEDIEHQSFCFKHMLADEVQLFINISINNLQNENKMSIFTLHNLLFKLFSSSSDFAYAKYQLFNAWCQQHHKTNYFYSLPKVSTTRHHHNLRYLSIIIKELNIMDKFLMKFEIIDEDKSNNY